MRDLPFQRQPHGNARLATVHILYTNPESISNRSSGIIQSVKSKNGFIIWLPRILSILFVLFLMLFSLDVFNSGASAGKIAVGLLVHSIPALVLLAATLISWRYEIVGGAAYILAGVGYILMVSLSGSFDTNEWIPILMITLPSFLIGTLFIIDWVKRAKK